MGEHIVATTTGSSSGSGARRDHDHFLSASDRAVLAQKHQFVRDDDVDAENAGDWGVRMAAKNYRQLFKEYAIVDLSRYVTGHVGMRWRVEKEVLSGKGQTTCGNKACSSAFELHSYEVPFKYEEHGERKHELVKVRVCLDCARKLFHDKLQRLERDRKKRRRKGGPTDAASSDGEQFMSHDDIVRALFDIGAAECKEDDGSSSSSSSSRSSSSSDGAHKRSLEQERRRHDVT
jgi:protein FRA10AC1